MREKEEKVQAKLRVELPQWILIAAMFTLAAVVWPSAPDQIPVHWGLSGQPDDYSEKFTGLLGLPLIALGVYLFLLFVPRLDPRCASYARFAGPYAVIRLSTMVLLASVHGFILLWIRGVELDVTVLAPILIGGFFVVIGNLLGKIRPNWFVGIKTPWTLTSKRSWVRTHRLGGWLFVLIGLVFVGSGLAGLASSVWTQAAILSITAICILWLLVYSYLVWRSDPERPPEARGREAGR